MATLDELVKAITHLQAEVVSSKDLAASLAERVSQLQDKVEKKEQNPTGVSWPGSSSLIPVGNPTNISLHVPSAIPLAPPERFSGDPLKAQSFLVQVELHFTCRPHTFPDAQYKVAFLLSYLTGDAATWAIPLVRKDSPSNFNRVVTETSWPEEKQAAFFYRGLKEELKDIVALIGLQPTDCQDLINLVLRLDHRLAERRGTRKKTEKYSWCVHDNRESRTQKEKNPEPMEIGTIGRPLTKDEKDLRRKNGQCLCCGHKGNFAKECPIKPKSKRGPVQKVAANAQVESENLRHPRCKERLKLGIKVQVKKKTYFKKALVDSGATGNVADAKLVPAWGIPCIEKKTPEIIQAVDGKLLTRGPVTLQTVPLSAICEEQKVVFSSALCKEQCLQKSQVPKICNSYRATAAEKEVKLPKQYSSYEDVFDEKEAENLPPHRPYDCQIDLIPGAILPNCRVYALSEHENQHLRKYLDQFLENGFILPSKSPAASPLFFVPKANGDLRACIDYRGLNKVTIKNKYPLPLIPVLLEQVKKAKIYTKLDLRGAYHLVRMREGDKWKTAFKTRYGLFEYTVMHFGLCNAPAAFQFFLNDVLREYLDILAIVYIDDILIYSDNENEHVQHVKKILAALRKHHLYCKLTMCEIHVTTVDFLGVIPTPQGMVMAEKKVKAVSDWPTPKTVCDVQCFLGFANFYRRFINHFSQAVAPITELLRKKEKFVWSPEADQAFSTFKEAFSTAPVLTHPDANRPFIVEADSSDVAKGAVLSQRNKDTGQLHPVAYMSRKLNEAEHNFVIAEKELLVICDAFK
ncbi:hypothetical protein NDU88_005772 [Pleurodeles waltl]|uniref:ribonuclease H n=1 Tax=Pleurodeles waltl TaxID=8319 RepID=A0AAV7WY16_PLEWA|nr:hypothetical protein NDU88_005772 [Pleurodeles waltl]